MCVCVCVFLVSDTQGAYHAPCSSIWEVPGWRHLELFALARDLGAWLNIANEMGAAPDLSRSCPAPARSRASDMQLHCFGGPCNEGPGVEDRIQPGVTPLGSQRWRCTYLTTGGTVGKLTARLCAKSADCPIFGFAVIIHTLTYAHPWRRAHGHAQCWPRLAGSGRLDSVLHSGAPGWPSSLR